MTPKTALLASLLGFAPLAWANDTSLGLDSGNIVFKQSDGIIMRSEDLYISPETVRVKYEFHNGTAADIKTLVGFPIPPIPLDDEGDINYNPRSPNPLDFSTRVDGKTVPVKMRRVEKNGKVEYTYLWEQTFPAGKSLTVEHRYRAHPTVSFYVDSPDVIKAYCLEPALAARLKARDAMPTTHVVRYILKTGANWKGPIGQFRLVLDKLNSKTLVSLCGDRIRKISPVRFEMRKTDFKPDKDLAILFLTEAW